MENQTIHGVCTKDIKSAIVELIAETSTFNDDVETIKKHVLVLKTLYDYVEDVE